MVRIDGPQKKLAAAVALPVLLIVGIAVASVYPTASNQGYAPEQGSDLYLVSGDHDDSMYHDWGIFTISFEMRRGSQNRYYPTLGELTSDINNNRDAVLYFLEQADCPYRAAGLQGEHC